MFVPAKKGCILELRRIFKNFSYIFDFKLLPIINRHCFVNNLGLF